MDMEQQKTQKCDKHIISTAEKLWQLLGGKTIVAVILARNGGKG